MIIIISFLIAIILVPVFNKYQNQAIKKEETPEQKALREKEEFMNELFRAASSGY